MNRKTMAIAGALSAAGFCAMALPSWAALETSFPNPAAHASVPDGLQVARGGGGGRGGGMGGGARGAGSFGGGSRDVRGGSFSSVNTGAARNGNFNGAGAAGGGRYAGNGNFNGNTVNRNNNVVVNGGGYGGYYGGWDDGWRPGTAAAVAATTIAAAAIVGSVVNSVPAGCGTVMANGYSYYQCGSTWYQPQYAGSSVQYVVVNAPQ